MYTYNKETIPSGNGEEFDYYVNTGRTGRNMSGWYVYKISKAAINKKINNGYVRFRVDLRMQKKKRPLSTVFAAPRRWGSQTNYCLRPHEVKTGLNR